MKNINFNRSANPGRIADFLIRNAIQVITVRDLGDTLQVVVEDNQDEQQVRNLVNNFSLKTVQEIRDEVAALPQATRNNLLIRLLAKEAIEAGLIELWK